MARLAQVKALVWKNWIILKRNGRSTLCEIMLPMLFCCVMVAIWATSTLETKPLQDFSGSTLLIPPLAAIPLRLALSRQHLVLTATSDMGSRTAMRFQSFINAWYPPFEGTSIFPEAAPEELRNLYIPPLASRVYTFSSEAEMEVHIRSKAYDEGAPLVWAAIVFDDANTYAIRMNSSEVVSTTGPSIDIWRAAVQQDNIYNYVYNTPSFGDNLSEQLPADALMGYPLPGFMALQLLVDRFLINSTSGNSTLPAQIVLQHFRDSIAYSAPSLLPALNSYLEQVRTFANSTVLDAITAKLSSWLAAESLLPQEVSVCPGPTLSYTENPFYSGVGSVFPLFVVLSFLLTIARSIRVSVLETELKAAETMQVMGISWLIRALSWLVVQFVIFSLASLLCAVVLGGSLYRNIPFAIVLVLLWLFGMSALCFCFLITSIFSQARVGANFGMVAFLGLAFPYYGVGAATISSAAKLGASICAPTAFSIGLDILAQLSQGNNHVPLSAIRSSVLNASLANCCYFLFGDSCLYLVLGVLIHFIRQSSLGFLGSTAASLSGSQHSVTTPVSALNEDCEPTDEVAAHQVLQHRTLSIRGLSKSFRGARGGMIRAVNQLSLDLFDGQIFALLGHNGAGKSTTISMLSGSVLPDAGIISYRGSPVRQVESMGFCPQHDFLYPDLTVGEHINLYSLLRNLTVSDSHERDVLNEVALTSMRGTLCKVLSGGQKRKLCLAISLLGDPRIVFLDEPTTGMDPYSRRFTWKLLQEKRLNRIIILTTHFMDEADILGDRIAIMHHGSLRCIGRPSFLKRRFGVGYRISCISRINPSLGDSMAEKLQMLARGITVENKSAGEIGFNVPFDAEASMVEVLRVMDENESKGKVEAYSLGMTTMEDVFCKVAMEERAAHEQVAFGSDMLYTRHPQPHQSSRQACAIIAKRSRYAVRDMRSLAFQLAIPWVILTGGLALVRLAIPNEMPSLKLSVSTMFTGPSYSFAPTVVRFDYKADWPSVIGAVHSPQFVNFWAHEGLRASVYNAPAADSIADPFGFKTSAVSPVRDLQMMSALFLSSAPQFGGLVFTADGSSTQAEPASQQITKDASYVVMTNTSMMHGAPFWVSMVNSALRTAVSEGNTSRIHTSSFPLPYSTRQAALLVSYLSGSAATIMMIAFAFIPASVAAYIVREREVGFKHQQMLASVSSYTYWLASWAADLIVYVPCAAGCMALFSVFEVEHFAGSHSHRAAAMAAMLAAYGWAIFPYTYLLSHMFSSHSAAQTYVLIANMIAVLLMIVSMIMGQALQTASLCSADRVLRYVYRILSPGFNLGNGMYALAFLEALPSLNANCDRARGDAVVVRGPYDAFDMPATGVCIIFMIVEGFLYITLCIALDERMWARRCMARFVGWVCPGASPVMLTGTTNRSAEPIGHVALAATADQGALIATDGGVAEEQQQAASCEADDPNVHALVDDLWKWYSPTFAAVRGLSLKLTRGEIFGLLGVNGSGKSTSLSILMAQQAATRGRVLVRGNSPAWKDNFAGTVGYCSQADSLLEHLSTREHLEFIGTLLGYTDGSLSSIIDYIVQAIGLEFCIRTRAGVLSGGSKRKLCVAMALMSNPDVLVLDEPSSGMDPLARRCMWNAISQFVAQREHKPLVLLTTHSMEECVALATRVGIMVQGQLRCLGSIPHLQTTFGMSYFVELVVTPPTATQVAECCCDIRAKLTPVEGTPAGRDRDFIDFKRATQFAEATGNLYDPGDTALYDSLKPIFRREDGHAEVAVDTFALWLSATCLLQQCENAAVRMFDGSKCIERQGFLLRIEIPMSNRRLVDIFTNMELLKSQQAISSYTASQTTLDQIFTKLASNTII